MYERSLPDGDDSLSPAPAPLPGPPGTLPAPSTQESDAFSAFYRRFVPTLVGFLIWHGASVHLAADVAQDTMRKAWQHWPTLRHPEAWARTTAIRALIRHLLKERETPVDQVPASSLISSPDAIAELEQRHTVVRLVRALPFRQRQVLAFTLDGLTPVEIAGELETTPEAVRASLMKARRRIAELLRREEEQDHDA